MSEEADPDGSTSSSYFAMIKISPRREREIRQGEAVEEKEEEEEKKRDERSQRKRETDAGATCTGAGRTDVRTYERTKVGLSYDSVCSRGPALDPAKRIFFLFFISSSAAPP